MRSSDPLPYIGLVTGETEKSIGLYATETEKVPGEGCAPNTLGSADYLFKKNKLNLLPFIYFLYIY